MSVLPRGPFEVDVDRDAAEDLGRFDCEGCGASFWFRIPQHRRELEGGQGAVFLQLTDGGAVLCRSCWDNATDCETCECRALAMFGGVCTRCWSKKLWERS
jgi:hypothetical protein